MVATCLLVGSSAAYADLIADYNFTTITDPNENTETFLSSSVDTSGISNASVMTSPSTDFTSTAHTTTRVNPEFGDVYNNAGNQAIGWSARSNNPATDFGVYLPVNTFFTFNNVSVVGPLSYETLTVDTGVFNTLGNLTAYDYTLSYSLDNVSFSVVSTINSGAGPNQAATITANGTAVRNISFDLSAIGNQSGTVFFRLDPIASTGAFQNGAQSQRAGFIDNVQLFATPVPEPSSILLLSGLFTAGLFRRRKNSA